MVALRDRCFSSDTQAWSLGSAGSPTLLGGPNPTAVAILNILDGASDSYDAITSVDRIWDDEKVEKWKQLYIATFNAGFFMTRKRGSLIHTLAMKVKG